MDDENDESAAGRFAGFTDDQDFDPDQPDAAKPFELADPAVLPPGLVPAALDASAAFAARSGIALDVPSFVPTRAAVLKWDGYSMGEPVIGLVTWRGVGEVRLNGVPGLLVAETTVVEEAAVEALAGARVQLYFVAFATMADAERVALVRTPGFPLPLERAVESAR